MLEEDDEVLAQREMASSTMVASVLRTICSDLDDDEAEDEENEEQLGIVELSSTSGLWVDDGLRGIPR